MTRKAPRPWSSDPFKVGVLGIALMLTGYFLMRGEGQVLAGRLIFYLGLAVIASACVLWYTQAQAETPREGPDEPAEEEAEEELPTDG
jgi:hypothetical protein